MGNFYGGSTVIKAGRFASHDPADDSRAYPARKRKVAIPQKSLGSAREALLHVIIDQMLMGREVITIPKTTQPELQAAIDSTGSPVTWARNQAEFEKLYPKKKKQQTERERRCKEKATPVQVEVKRKKPPTAKHPALPSAKPEPTPEERYKANRMALIRNLVDQMVKCPGSLKVPRIDSVLLAELKSAGSPLLWLQAQPDYEAVFKARYLAQQKVSTHAPKKPTEPPRKKKKAKKQKKPKDGVLAEGKAKGNQPKKKRVKHYYDPYEKPSRPVTPLSDAPVSYILKQLDKAADEPFNPRKIDWDVT